jgi:NADH:ubiquinone oxidoreductase subunit 3 (subunit A)
MSGKMYKNSSAKHATVRRYTAGQETIMSCTYWSKNCHIISGYLSFGLLYVTFDLCIVAG